MTIAKEFYEALQKRSKMEPLVAEFLEKNHYRDELTFETILKEYTKYLSELSDTDKKKFSNLFWELIKFFGTPIIEYDLQDKNKCNVYFLFPKDQLANNNDIFLQGAFHGYGGIKERNKLVELDHSGILYRINSIPTNSILNYQFQQKDASTLNDPNSSHRNMYHHRYSGGVILRVNPDPKQSHLGKPLGKEEENYWDRMVSTENHDSSKHFKYHHTFYSDSNHILHTCDSPLPQKVDIYDPVPPQLTNIPNEDFSSSPYANFTHAVHIFKPSSDNINIKHVMVFNDGRPYILAGMMDQAEKMLNSGKLPADTAFVFIDPIQGLAKTMLEIEKDERFIMGGMGIRLIDFDKGIDNYITFLKSLFSQLSEKNINIPNVPSFRVMVGSSLSGTATICIALKEPALFNHFIAQSPSPTNDEILNDLTANPEVSIQLSCGLFEQPLYNDSETDCFTYANQLQERLNLKFHPGVYGHNHAACVVDLERSLPEALKENVTSQEDKVTSKASIHSQSIFSQSKESTSKTNNKDETIQVLRKKGG